MEFNCQTCDEEFVIEYSGDNEISICPFCGADIHYDGPEVDLEEDWD